MEHFPEKALTNVAVYLNCVDKVLFAAALTTAPLSWESNTPPTASLCRQLHQFVMSTPNYYRYPSGKGEYALFKPEWDYLDFEDNFYLVESMRNKLTGSDLFGILIAIGARENLKRIDGLPNNNIVGHGLAPLRGSAV